MTTVKTAGIVFAGLLPHAPIAVPEVGGARGAACRATTEACRKLAQRLLASNPARVLLVSPHAPRHRAAFGLWADKRLQGDLGEFGARGVAVDLPDDSELVGRIRSQARAEQVETWLVPPQPLDHGALVPLSFLAREGWRGPTALVSLPLPGGPAKLEAFGRALARAASRLHGGTALVASGDLSHRVLPGAPAGFHPRAREFDQEVRSRIEQGRLAELSAIDPALRALAAEDVVETTTIVAAALGERHAGGEVLSYEHPYGVGYLVAVLHREAGRDLFPGG